MIHLPPDISTPDFIPPSPAVTATPELSMQLWIDRFLRHYRGRQWSKMHEWLGPQLDLISAASGQKLNVLAPRGSAKSTFVTLAYVLREAVTNRQKYIWIVSETNSQAAGHLEHLKYELSNNKELADCYQAAVQRGSPWKVGSIRLGNDVLIEAFGTGQSVRGRRNSCHRPSLIVCDDLQGDKHVDSPQRRGNDRNWFHGGLLKAGNKQTNVINLATALHRDALALELARTPGWQTAVFRAIQQWPEDMLKWVEWETIYTNLNNPLASQEADKFFNDNCQDMQKGAVLLWPEEEDLYTLMKLRVESGQAAFDREKQNVPTNSESHEWPSQYFDNLPMFDVWPDKLLVKSIALDPSKGRESHFGDYSAFVKLGVAHDATLYVEAQLERLPTPLIVQQGVTLWCDFRPDVFGLETNLFQELLAPEFVDEFRRRGLVPMEPLRLENHTSKLVRIRRLGTYLSRRRMRFRSASPGTQLLIEQLRDFPRGEYDDGPDALEMAIRIAEDFVLDTTMDDGLSRRSFVDE